ncbi:MAG TPA: T9SS type A sorting domain-containing protein, partial [Gemmatimonadales bacterium]|nr:T9SS type A sorting domain-containing protein [Gemmatimonadales bacterium]
LSYTASAPISLNTTSAAQLALVHTVPDPYYVTNALEITPNNKVLKFVNLPPQAIVRIYSVSGILVQVLTHNDPTGGGELDWDLRNRSNQFVASGVYFYHVEAADGKTKVGRFTVVQFAP